MPGRWKVLAQDVLKAILQGRRQFEKSFVESCIDICRRHLSHPRELVVVDTRVSQTGDQIQVVSSEPVTYAGVEQILKVRFMDSHLERLMPMLENVQIPRLRVFPTGLSIPCEIVGDRPIDFVRNDVVFDSTSRLEDLRLEGSAGEVCGDVDKDEALEPVGPAAADVVAGVHQELVALLGVMESHVRVALPQDELLSGGTLVKMF